MELQNLDIQAFKGSSTFFYHVMFSDGQYFKFGQGEMEVVTEAGTGRATSGVLHFYSMSVLTLCHHGKPTISSAGLL